MKPERQAALARAIAEPRRPQTALPEIADKPNEKGLTTATDKLWAAESRDKALKTIRGWSSHLGAMSDGGLEERPGVAGLTPALLSRHQSRRPHEVLEAAWERRQFPQDRRRPLGRLPPTT